MSNDLFEEPEPRGVRFHSKVKFFAFLLIVCAISAAISRLAFGWPKPAISGTATAYTRAEIDASASALMNFDDGPVKELDIIFGKDGICLLVCRPKTKYDGPYEVTDGRKVSLFSKGMVQDGALLHPGTQIYDATIHLFALNAAGVPLSDYPNKKTK